MEINKIDIQSLSLSQKDREFIESLELARTFVENVFWACVAPDGYLLPEESNRAVQWC